MKNRFFIAVCLVFFSWGWVFPGPVAGAGEPDYTICRVRSSLQTILLHGYTRARWQRLLTCEESGRCLKVRA
ncbi:MAG: hypothetical protein GXO34_03945, partial [Deltaproteobacteria bacterium]|nr:hypothetical protein [Deltaproteobacteria bacterium]